MLKGLAFVLLSLSICLSNCYINPVQGNVDSPDPGVMRDVDGTYYAATTGGTATQKFRLWKSKDMGSWLFTGFAFSSPPAWTDGGDFWAP
jgi:beta-xylosidase